jgi:zinc transport system substrate-binding protein
VIVLADAAGIVPDKDKDKDEAEHEHEHHDGHGDDDDHHHGTDPHIWLDPVLVEKMIAAEAKVLRDVVGDDAAAAVRVTAAETAVLKRVRAVDERYRTTIGSAARRTIVVGHDAWGYLARRYGIETVAIKGLTASEPTPAAMQAAVKAVRDKKAKCVFAEPQLGRAAADHIAAATGVPVRTLDPLGDGDWFQLMDANLKELAGAMDAKLAPATDADNAAPR